MSVCMSIFELKKPEQWPEWLVHGMITLLKIYGVRSDGLVGLKRTHQMAKTAIR